MTLICETHNISYLAIKRPIKLCTIGFDSSQDDASFKVIKSPVRAVGSRDTNQEKYPCLQQVKMVTR